MYDPTIAVARRERRPSWLQNDPLLSTCNVAQLKKYPSMLTGTFIENCVSFATSIVFVIWYILMFMLRLAEECQIGWKTKYGNSFETLKWKVEEAGNTNLMTHNKQGVKFYLDYRRAYNYSSWFKKLSRWPESNIGLPFSSLVYAGSFSWDHSLQIERIIMFAV